MDRYVGLDAHAQTCTLAVMGPTGKRLTSRVVETNGHALRAAIGEIPGRIHLCLEEGTQSAWLYEILEPQVSEIVARCLRTRPWATRRSTPWPASTTGRTSSMHSARWRNFADGISSPTDEEADPVAIEQAKQELLEIAAPQITVTKTGPPTCCPERC